MSQNLLSAAVMIGALRNPEVLKLLSQNLQYAYKLLIISCLNGQWYFDKSERLL